MANQAFVILEAKPKHLTLVNNWINVLKRKFPDPNGRFGQLMMMEEYNLFGLETSDNASRKSLRPAYMILFSLISRENSTDSTTTKPAQLAPVTPEAIPVKRYAQVKKLETDLFNTKRDLLKLKEELENKTSELSKSNIKNAAFEDELNQINIRLEDLVTGSDTVSFGSRPLTYKRYRQIRNPVWFGNLLRAAQRSNLRKKV